MIKISPSLLSADMARLADAVNLVKGAADYVHCDVMDGHFVPNLTFGAPVIKALKKLNAVPLDVHLMIEEPGKWIQDYLDAGLDSNDFLVFHLEPESDPETTLRRIRDAGVQSGLALKPATPFAEAEHLMDFVDQILIMTVEPGFGNQKFMADMLPKIREAKSKARSGQIIAVDGGINPVTAKQAIEAGASMLIAGGAIYGREDPLKAIDDIRG